MWKYYIMIPDDSNNVYKKCKYISDFDSHIIYCESINSALTFCTSISVYLFAKKHNINKSQFVIARVFEDRKTLRS